MKKRNLKGMTLMEIVVSMAVYGVLALLLVEIMSCVNGTMRITNQLNKRLAYEAKFADNRLTKEVTEEGERTLTGEVRDLSIIYNKADYDPVNDTGRIYPEIISTPSRATEYEAPYENPNHEDDDKSAGTNYKYLVYAPPSATELGDYFTVTIKVDPSYDSEFKIISIASTVGDFTKNPDGDWVNNKIEYPDPDTGLQTGRLDIEYTVYCDMTSKTGYKNQPIYGEDGKKIGDSNNYPAVTANSSYVTWRKDTSGKLIYIQSEAVYYINSEGEFKEA